VTRSLELSATDTFYVKSLREKFREYQQKIYGKDDRKPVIGCGSVGKVSQEDILKLSKSVVAFFPKSALEISPDNKFYVLKRKRLLDRKPRSCSFGLCLDTPFGNEPSVAFGTGFVIGPNTVITAGHVTQSDAFNDGFVVFDFIQDVDKIDASNVYTIKSVLPRKKGFESLEYNVVEVDREFAPIRQSLLINYSNSLKNRAPVFMLGFPSGLPMKVSSGAQALDIDLKGFLTNLDAFSGNSGSPIFNDKGQVEGILISGAIDYGDGNNACCTILPYPVKMEDGPGRELVLRLQFLKQ
jgi:hypothetical protein